MNERRLGALQFDQEPARFVRTVPVGTNDLVQSLKTGLAGMPLDTFDAFEYEGSEGTYLAHHADFRVLPPGGGNTCGTIAGGERFVKIKRPRGSRTKDL
jgi:hypothetical protein